MALRACGKILAALVLPAGAAFSSETTVEAAIAAARGADVVIVGEVHDNPIHHEVQARFAAELAPAAIVFEMLRPGDPAIIATLPGAPAEEIAGALGWADRGWPDFAAYHRIFAAAPSARLVGAETPREAVRAAVAGSAAAAFAGDAARFGLDRPLPPEEQAAREALQAEAHCNALPTEMLPGMVEAQRLRDATLARAALEAGPGPVLVITGNGHADRDRGLPAPLSRAAPDLRVYVFQQFEVPPADPHADAWHVTAPAERPDPCAVFR